jgi:hypothetical protein
VEARRWRRIGWAAAVLGVLVVGLLAGWVWYAWFGSIPKTVFSVRFPQPAYAGQSVIGGKECHQLVFLHGGTLARYDLKQRKQIWSLELLDPKTFSEMANAQMQALQQRNLRLRDQGREDLPRLPDMQQLNESAAKAAEGQLTLHVNGQNIWVVSPGKAARYDWETGQPIKEVTAPGDSGGLISRGDQVLVVDSTQPKPTVTHLNLANCESHNEEVASPEARLLAGNPPHRSRSTDSMGGLPSSPGKDMDKALDPAKVAAQAQRLGKPGQTALPAVLANTINQERLLAELNDDGSPKPPPESTTPPPNSSFALIPDQDGFVQFSVKLLEARMVQRSAMKAPPARSALAGGGPGLDTTAASTELLNQVQRERGGETITEDMSRYQVTLQGPGNAAAWTGELTGPPRFLPLQTVNVLAANNQVVVLDKANKELWRASLLYNVGSGPGESGERAAGLGPCVERKGSLYVFDEGKLTAFNLATGAVRWSLPSVGISGILFDDQDMIYVNSTTASPDTIKYKRQIELADKVNPIVLEVDSRNGGIRWQKESVGQVSYASGNFIYAVQTFEPSGEDENPFAAQLGSEPRPFLHIRRLNPKNGREMWDHFQERAPLDVGFDQNTLRLVFKKEVQVLRFFAGF